MKFSSFLIQEDVAEIINEDIVNVLDKFLIVLKKTNRSEQDIKFLKRGLIVVAMLRVYKYLNNEEDKAKVGLSALVGSVNDAEAVKNLYGSFNVDGSKAQNIMNQELKVLRDMFRTGKGNGYRELINATNLVKKYLQS